jgi:Cu(I)/Ag(I) efflux system membrane protein CusA/SilA
LAAADFSSGADREVRLRRNRAAPPIGTVRLPLLPRLRVLPPRARGLNRDFLPLLVGADIMKPIAAPIVGGMITSTIHVLVITPVIFYILKVRALGKGELKVSGMTV